MRLAVMVLESLALAEPETIPEQQAKVVAPAALRRASS
ncbi:MAG: hypothetical protein ACI9MC_002741 [Kiritimatiellia bacterium]|jgi:hypothetical protein